MGPLALGVIPGATPGKWIDAWQERMPRVELNLHPISVAEQGAALREGGLDAALVRLPIDADGLHIIPLYDERPVAVAAADSHLMAADELDLADLAGEIVVVPRDDVLRLAVPGAIAPSFAPPEDTEMAIATVAAGIGVVIVPMSLARLHHRKDVDYRPLRDGPVVDRGAGLAGRSDDAGGAGLRRHRARAHAELLALTGSSSGEGRGMSPTWVPATSPADPTQEAACPEHAATPAPNARQSPDTGCCESSPNNRSTVSAP